MGRTRTQESHWEEQGIALREALVSMSEFGELWKQQNSPACTKNASLQNTKVGHHREEEIGQTHTLSLPLTHTPIHP